MASQFRTTRQRGVTLTLQGSRKLNRVKAEVEIEQNFKRYTLEALSEKTGLTPNTLSKVFTGSAGVDKRTLQCLFDAFNMTLSTEDYLLVTTNLPQIHKMDRSNDESQSRPPTVPGGQIPLDSVSYINRPILQSLCYEAIQQTGAMLYIRAAKQIGKTSLMTRILTRASSLGYQTVSVNLQLADTEILQNLERFLKWFCTRVSQQLDLSNASADFGDNCLGSKANTTDYFENVLLVNCDRPLVIAIDELNQLFAYPDITGEFLLLLRTWSEQAKARVADSNQWDKLRLATVHSTEILMSPAINPSLLNTGLVIELPEFTPAQVQELAKRWEQEISEPQIEQLITLLGGHPYRLQLAFYHLQQQTITLAELLANSEIAFAIYADHLEQQWWNLQRYPDLLSSLRQIVRQSNPVDCEAEKASQLHKMGLVHLHGSQASLACELFRPFFCARVDPKWVL